MSKLVPALLAAVVVAVVAGALWFASSGSETVVDTTGGKSGETPGDPRPPRPADEKPHPGDGTPRPPDSQEPPVRPPAPRKPWDEGPPLVDPVGEPVPGAGLRFAFPQWPEAALVDWSRAGLLARKAQRQLRRAAIRVMEGEDFDGLRADLEMAFAPVSHVAQPLVAASLALDIDPLSPFGSVMAFPPFESNIVAGTLAAWNRPLSDDQVKAIHELYRAHAAVWLENRPVPTEERTLESVIRIAKSREALQPKLEEILTESQRDALWPPETKGRLGLDFLSPATMLRDRVVLLQNQDEKETRTEFARRLLVECTLGHMPPERIEKLLGEWLDTMPDGWRKGPRSALGHAGLLPFEEASPWLYELPRLLTSLENGGPRHDPRFKRLKKVLIPVR